MNTASEMTERSQRSSRISQPLAFEIEPCSSTTTVETKTVKAEQKSRSWCSCSIQVGSCIRKAWTKMTGSENGETESRNFDYYEYLQSCTEHEANYHNYYYYY